MKRLAGTIKNIKEIDHRLAEETQKRLDNLTKPHGSLGRLEELAKRIVEITEDKNPSLKRKVIFTLAGDHGVTEEGISAYPKEVTQQMVLNFINGGAGINVLARHAGARVVVVDMGVASKIIPQKRDPVTGGKKSKVKSKNFRDKKINYGTKNMVKGPAMTKEEAIRSIEAGIEIFEEELPNGIDIVGTGDMGIGNTTPSSAIAAVITKKSVEEVTGKGTGIDDRMLAKKIEVIKKAISINKPDPNDSIDVLSKVGGFEMGGLAGIILVASASRVPVVIDGFISAASALIAYRLEPRVKDYIIASHRSVEKGHKIILDYLGLNPILDLNLRLGEGTGAALAMNIIEAGARILTEMATFQSASVSEKIR